MKKNGRIRKRKKVKERRRQRMKKTFKSLAKLIIFLSFITGLVFAGKKVEDFLASSSFFQIKEVNFKGANCLEQEVLKNLANIQLGENIFRLNLKEVQKRLEGHPLVRESSVLREFPDAVTVDIKERTAVAFLEDAGQIYPVDMEGVLLPAVNPSPSVNVPGDRSLPLIRGVKWYSTAGDGYELRAGEKIRCPKLDTILGVLEVLAASDIGISEIGLSGNRPVLMSKGTKVLLGQIKKTSAKEDDCQLTTGHAQGRLDLANFNLRTDKVKELKIILSDLAERKEEAEYIDLSFTRPVVKLR